MVSVNGIIDPRSYLPGRMGVSNAVKDISSYLRERLVAYIQKGRLRHEGAVTVDGVHLKVQGKHC